jgi:signal peptidase I
MKFLRKNAGLIAVLVLVVGLLVFARFSGMVHVVATGSMEPTLSVNTIVVDTSTKNVRAGDIITFQATGMKDSVTHRLVQINKDGSLITKGDANPTVDNPDVALQKSDVIGKLWFEVPILVPSFWISLRGIIFAVFVLIPLLIYLTKPNSKEEKGGTQLEKDREETLESNPV